MEEVDRLLFQSLRLIGWEDGGEAKSVGQLSGEEGTEAVIRCLWAAQPSSKTLVPSHILPPNMTSRFKIATHIADAISALGYRGELGYQTILYGTEAQLRQILLFLVEKLPRESGSAPEAQQHYLEWALGAGREKLAGSLKAPWLPHYCRALHLLWDGRLWHPPPDPTTDFRSQGSGWRNFPAAVIHASSASQLSDRPGMILEQEMMRASQVPRPRPRPKPAIAPKPRSLSSASQPEPQPETPSADEVEMERLEGERNMLMADADNVAVRIATAHRQLTRVGEDRRALEVEEKADSVERSGLRRWANALQDPTEALRTLKGFQEESDGRLMELEKKWREASDPIRMEIHKIKTEGPARVEQGEAEKVRRELEELRRSCQEMVLEAEGKEAFIGQLVRSGRRVRERRAVVEERELSRTSGGGLNRQAYTERILEIVASVQKQRAEIDKVVGERAEVEGDVNRLRGKLERTLVAAEALLFAPAKTDAHFKRAYKLLLALHSRCQDSLSTLADTGAVQREIQDLDNLVERERDGGTEESLERLVTDLCSVRQENHDLAAKITALDPSFDYDS